MLCNSDHTGLGLLAVQTAIVNVVAHTPNSLYFSKMLYFNVEILGYFVFSTQVSADKNKFLVKLTAVTSSVPTIYEGRMIGIYLFFIPSPV